MLPQYPDVSAIWLLQQTENIQGLIELIANELIDAFIHATTTTE